MPRKTATIDLKGKEYAQVKDRILEFRHDNPHGLIETEPTITDGLILFKAHILKDKGDPNSAEASGHARGKDTGDKAFEKLETIAVGRALALLGYAAGGEIASSDEMEEFEEFQEEKRREILMTCTENLTSSKDLVELQAVWVDVPPFAKVELLALKDDLKTRFVKPVKKKIETDQGEIL